MAEVAILRAILQAPLEKASSLAAGEFSLLWGFKKHLAKLERSLNMVQGFLHGFQRGREVNDEAIKVWLQNLEDVVYDADNVLDDVKYEILRRKIEIRNQLKRKVRFFFSLSNPILFRSKMAHKIQEINNNLKDINEEARGFGLQIRTALANIPQVLPPQAVPVNRETDSISIASNFIGRKEETSEIVKLLMTSADDPISVIPIRGMGGMGKTSLAQKIFNHQQIKGQFEKRIWACVSENFEVTKLLDLMIESLIGRRLEADTREAKVKRLQTELEGKKYLLVLDDVWNDNYAVWNDFMESLKSMNTVRGNFILVTTRLQEVASRVETSKTFQLRELSDDDCWFILKEKAFYGREVPEELQSIGFEMAKKCKGLPLLANVLGGLLYKKGRDEWVSIIENELHNLREDDYAMQILRVSFDHLPSLACKNCFAYCCIFPKDYGIRRKKIIQLYDLFSLHSLHSLHITSCPNLQSIPSPTDSIRRLWISDCRNLMSFLPIGPDQIQIPSLVVLRLIGCPKLNCMPSLGCLSRLHHLSIGPSDNMELEYFRDHVLDGLNQLSSTLRILYLHGCANWNSLPDQLQHLFALHFLSLNDFGIEALPNWLGNLSSITELQLNNCEKLQYLPSAEAMRRLTKLSILSVENCPLLKERCINQRSSPDSERSKISHISSVTIDGVWIKE